MNKKTTNTSHKITTATDPIECQILEWYSRDEPLNGDDSSESSDAVSEDDDRPRSNYISKVFTVYLFGVTQQGQVVGMRLTDFKPFFYVKIPKTWRDHQIKQFISKLQGGVYPKEYKEELLAHRVVSKMNFYGFENFERHQFLKLEFQSFEAFRKYEFLIKSLKSGEKRFTIDGQSWPRGNEKFLLYESNIEPLIRCIHLLKIKAAGWIHLEKYTQNKPRLFYSDIDISTHWKNVQPVDTDIIAPIKIGSFDIEANSSHGDFPMAAKDYIKLYQDIINQYHYLKNKIKNVAHQHHIAGLTWGKVAQYFENPEFIYNLIWYAFYDTLPKDAVERILKRYPIQHPHHARTIRNLLADAAEIHHIFTKQEIKPVEKTVRQVVNQVYPMYKHMFTIGRIMDTFDPKMYKQNFEYKFLEVVNQIADYEFTEQFNEWIYVKKGKVAKQRNKVQKDLDYIEVLNKCITILRYANVRRRPTAPPPKRVPNNQPTQNPAPRADSRGRDLNDVLQRVCNIKLAEKLPKNDFKRLVEHLREFCKTQILEIFNQHFPPIKGDIIIQIGMTTKRVGDHNVQDYYIATLKSCEQFDPNVTIQSFDDEKDVIIAWAKHTRKINVDVLTGYNIFGFDYEFIWQRAQELGITHILARILTRIRHIPASLRIKELSSSGLGDNLLKLMEMPGRITVDLMKVIQKDYRLDSYKLDSTANNFMRGIIQSARVLNSPKYSGGKITEIITSGIDNLEVGNYVNILVDNGIYIDQYKNGHKYKILRKHTNDPDNIRLVVLGAIRGYKEIPGNMKIYWCECKDDISPQQIFAYQDKGPVKRGIIAKYCLKDCELVTRMIERLDVIINNISMANVCYVPLSYLFLRGQGVKSYSLVSRQCRLDGYLIPTIRALEDFKDDPDMEDSYEGAIVLDPIPNIWSIPNKPKTENTNIPSSDTPTNTPPIDTPDTHKRAQSAKTTTQSVTQQPTVQVCIEGDSATAVCDFNSLYPSCIIAEGASHDTIVLDDAKYGHIEGIKYNIVEHNVIKGKGEKKVIVGRKAVKYAILPDDKQPVIPTILRNLLQARKDVRKRQATITDKFKKAILEGQQLAYKVTANSMYGQLGATTSPIFLKDLAATTTASGQKNLLFARDFFLKWFTPEKLPEFIDTYQSKFTVADYGSMGFFVPKDLEAKGLALAITDENRDKGLRVITTRQELIDAGFIFDIKADAITHPVIAIYGDTDSVFMHFRTRFNGTMAVFAAIQMAREGAFIISRSLKRPNNLELEKAIFPFILLSKKRYVGHYYTKMFKNTYYLQSMGIVLKRRDNAPIVKIIYGNVVRIIMQEHDIPKARAFVSQFLDDLLAEKFPLSKFIISKTLKGHYANPDSIAHKVLATRMAIRDPGNKPQVNDRIQFAYIQTGDPNALQGDRIEHPDYIRKHGLKIDYAHYITNQIMVPVCQIFALVEPNPEAMFEDALRKCENRALKLQAIDSIYKPIVIPAVKESVKPAIKTVPKQVVKRKPTLQAAAIGTHNIASLFNSQK